MNRGRGGGWKPWFGRGRGRGIGARAKPVMSRAGNKNNDNNANDDGFTIDESSFSIAIEKGCPYNEWKLYFPKQKFSDSPDINKRIMAMKLHFKTYPQWYNLEAVATTFVFYLPMEKFIDDEEFEVSWPTWYEDFESDPHNSLAAVGLALHAVVGEILKKKGETNRFLKRIFVRPIGWRPVTPLKEVNDFEGKLMSTNGVVKSIEHIEAVPKYICFQCSTCSGQVCVNQSSAITTGLIIQPSTCVQGCPARSGFVALMASPFTIITPRQKLLLRDVSFQKEDTDISVEVELTEDQVGIVSAGSQIIITGVISYKHDSTHVNQAKNYKPFFQCYSVVCPKGMDFELYKHIQNNEIPEIVQMLRTEDNIFKLLVHSFCPDIYGREEAKAALVLGLLSGNELIATRRSDSHVLLVGNPGTGKSKLLMAAATLSPRGMFVCGTLASAAGLTSSVGTGGTVDAGALVLSDNGDCCIDELDKSAAAQNVLLEAMEQQEVSIAKCGAVAVLPARCSVLASANPNNSLYDRSKTVMQNMKFSPQLISRFDLIVPFAENIQTNNHHFTDYMMNRSNANSSAMERDFFHQTPSSANKNSHWLKFDPNQSFQLIPPKQLKEYIEYVKHKFQPRLMNDAITEIRTFYAEFSELCKGNEELNIYGPSRFIEAMIRLTLTRARAEMTDLATKEHVRDIMCLIKYNLIDIYGEYDQGGHTTSNNSFAPIKRTNVDNSKPLSKPKQMKLLMEYLTDKCDEESRDNFSVSEIKAFATELGIKEHLDIIYRLNNEGCILKTPEGYRVIKL